MIVLLAVLDGNLLKYDTLQENLFKVKSQPALYRFHAQYFRILPLESFKKTTRRQCQEEKLEHWYDHNLYYQCGVKCIILKLIM